MLQSYSLWGIVSNNFSVLGQEYVLICFKRVFVITGLRIQALHMVNAQDFTYSKGYLGLLSAIGGALGVIFCCIFDLYRIFRQFLRSSSWTRGLYLGNLRSSRMARHDKTVAARTREQPLPPEAPNDAFITVEETNCSLPVINGGWGWDSYPAIKKKIRSLPVINGRRSMDYPTVTETLEYTTLRRHPTF